ncbi:MAG: hypothetical protein JNK12_12945 [Acidimicrobiales bacterium]|nr:hypothetical protein [Acidimicrobiales bacterium]
MFRSSTTIDEALEEIVGWADSLPGDFSIDVVDHDDATTIDLHGALISSAVEVRASLVVTADATVLEYRFDVRRREGGLLWRHDRHLGHEHDPGMRGPEHLHEVRAGKEVRLPSDPVDLAAVRVLLVQTNLDLAR